jgi:hypothetical protein
MVFAFPTGVQDNVVNSYINELILLVEKHCCLNFKPTST